MAKSSHHLHCLLARNFFSFFFYIFKELGGWGEERKRKAYAPGIYVALQSLKYLLNFPLQKILANP